MVIGCLENASSCAVCEPKYGEPNLTRVNNTGGGWCKLTLGGGLREGHLFLPSAAHIHPHSKDNVLLFQSHHTPCDTDGNARAQTTALDALPPHFDFFILCTDVPQPSFNPPCAGLPVTFLHFSAPLAPTHLKPQLINQLGACGGVGVHFLTVILDPHFSSESF